MRVLKLATQSIPTHLGRYGWADSETHVHVNGREVTDFHTETSLNSRPSPPSPLSPAMVPEAAVFFSEIDCTFSS